MPLRLPPFRPMSAALGLLALLSATLPAFAAEEWPHEAACREWAKVAIPKQDIGSAPADCSAQALYYGRDGEGEGRDYVAARHCAYRQPREGNALLESGDMFGGSGVLMMLYANGQGVKRNPALAKHFACEYGGAPAEVSARLGHIDDIAGGGEPMDICDDVTSGMMMGFCARRTADFAKVGREPRWRALQAAWTPAQRAAWAPLRKAADDYIQLVSREETDMSGTARGMFSADARESLEIALLDAVTRFDGGDRPTQKASDFARADKTLNATYKDTMAKLAAGSSEGDGAFGDYGTIGPDGVRETQRAWLRYRDAWVRFAALRWPDTPADAWKAWLTTERAQALADLVHEG